MYAITNAPSAPTHSPRRDHQRSGRAPASRPVWAPWANNGWIATRDREVAFVADLRLLSAGSGSDHSRSDTTACLNALRCGLTVDELLDRTPGLRPARLAAAYSALEERRSASERAWSSIVASGSVAALVEHGEAAAALLPAVIGRLIAAAHNHPVGYATTVLRLAETVDKCRRDAYRIEHALARCAPGSDRGHQLSALLYQPSGDAAAGLDGFLADRVGLLTPTRVAALLGELDHDIRPLLDELTS